MPLISIIIPVYRVEEYLRRSIDSVLNQSYQDIEIILVDDKSPDNSPQICDEYATRYPGVKVIHKECNAGLGMACNSGLEIAMGKYVAFCDSDDWIDQEMYQTMLDTAEQYQADAVYTGLKRVDDQGNVDEMKHPSDKIVAQNRDGIYSILMDMIASAPQDPIERHIAMSAKTVLYRRDLLEKNHIRFESERRIISEDLFFNIDVLTKATSVVVLPNRFYNYFYNTQSLSSTVRIDRFQKAKDMRELLLTRYSHDALPEDFILRVNRWFIGYHRSDTKSLCKAQKLSIFKKWHLLNEITKDPIWKEINYPVHLMRKDHRIFHLLTIFHCTTLLLIISMFRR